MSYLPKCQPGTLFFWHCALHQTSVDWTAFTIDNKPLNSGPQKTISLIIPFRTFAFWMQMIILSTPPSCFHVIRSDPTLPALRDRVSFCLCFRPSYLPPWNTEPGWHTRRCMISKERRRNPLSFYTKQRAQGYFWGTVTEGAKCLPGSNIHKQPWFKYLCCVGIRVLDCIRS